MNDQTICEVCVRVSVCHRVKSVAFSVSQQFDRMSGMYTDYSSNVMLNCVSYIMFFDHVNANISTITAKLYYRKACIWSVKSRKPIFEGINNEMNVVPFDFWLSASLAGPAYSYPNNDIYTLAMVFSTMYNFMHENNRQLNQYDSWEKKRGFLPIFLRISYLINGLTRATVRKITLSFEMAK